MHLKDLLLRIDRLKSELDRLLPMDPVHYDRLWQKLRLEWNYNSNHIEGNTLTYSETFLLLIHGRTTGDHTTREIDEMRSGDAIPLHGSGDERNLTTSPTTASDRPFSLALPPASRSGSRCHPAAAHNVAIDMVRAWAQDQERELLESDIRDLNRVILKETFSIHLQTGMGGWRGWWSTTFYCGLA